MDKVVVKPLRARSYAEVFLYMDLHPCQCGSTLFKFKSSKRFTDHHTLCKYHGHCEDCGNPREINFVLPEFILPYSDIFTYGGDKPSSLIDAGQFLMVSDQYARSVPASIENQDKLQLEAGIQRLQIAIAALEEILKFIPENGDRLCEDDFFTSGGLQFYLSQPNNWFSRGRLNALHDAYHDILSNYRSAMNHL